MTEHNHLEYNTNYNEWDADRIQGCACDHGWEGYDCSERADCPLGDGPNDFDLKCRRVAIDRTRK